MEEIEAIVEEMESDRVPLDKLLAHYERGTRLVRFCQERLDQAQARIDLIQNQDSGSKGGQATPVLGPFQPETEPDQEPQASPAPSRPQPRAPSKGRKATQDHDDIRLL